MIAFISSAFLAGLVGSLHCIGMCGGFAVACGGRARDTFLWHAGRTATYAILGALAGAFGSMMPGPGWVVGVFSTLLIVWFAAGLAGLIPEPHLNIPGVKHLTTKLATRTNIIARFGFGMATGLLPCGLVYASLGIPVAASDPVVGALAMAGFGVGTMPALTAVAMGLRRVVMRDIRLRRALAAGVLMAALWSIGMRTGVFGGGPMHHGPGMEPAPGLEHEPGTEPEPGMELTLLPPPKLPPREHHRALVPVLPHRGHSEEEVVDDDVLQRSLRPVSHPLRPLPLR
jgi:sulfite exporter TauE/SafE